MLKVKDLSLEQSQLSLKDISFQAEKGEIVGIVGPNGAGKSLLIDSLSGYLAQCEGQVMLNHFNLLKEPERAKIHLGFLPDPPQLEPYLTGYEYLHTLGAIYRLSPKQRESQILEGSKLIGVEEYLYDLLYRLSPANQQKIALLASFFHQPDLVIWDEPTANLDFLGKQATATLAKELTKSGKTLIIATNDLLWLEPLLCSLIVLSKGEMLACGKLNDIARDHHISAKSLAGLMDGLFPSR